MKTLLIADDELIIRQGLKCIIDWEALDFSIIREAANGQDALQGILECSPDVALLDIRMPRLSGLDVAKQAREAGYQGKIIIVSGFSDFKYAQEAMRYGVTRYLTKPIDETILFETIQKIGAELDQEAEKKEASLHYQKQMRSILFADLLHGKGNLSQENAKELHFYAKSYQIVLCESYRRDKRCCSFAELLENAGQNNLSYESLATEQGEVLLLKGAESQAGFRNFLAHYERELMPQENSLLDTLFVTYGRVVHTLEDICLSYEEALRLSERRFFCAPSQHTFGYDRLPDLQSQDSAPLTTDVLNDFRDRLIYAIQSARRSELSQTLKDLENRLYSAPEDIPKIKLFLTDLFLSIKEKLPHLHHTLVFSFPGNTEIIKTIEEKCYLYEIFSYFTEQFEDMMRTIGNAQKSGTIDDVLRYIQQNYTDSIRLETIAPLFGYNSSYLGKVFSEKVGMSFNTYIDKIRLEHAKELLRKTDLKIYAVSTKVGFRNVDAFYTKFKKYTNQTPAEYRKTHYEERALPL